MVERTSETKWSAEGALQMADGGTKAQTSVLLFRARHLAALSNHTSLMHCGAAIKSLRLITPKIAFPPHPAQKCIANTFRAAKPRVSGTYALNKCWGMRSLSRGP